MSVNLVFLLSILGIIPTIIGIIQVRNTANILPITISLLLGLIASLLIYLLKEPYLKNLCSSIYIATEFVLLLFQLRNWGVLKKDIHFYVIVTSGLLIWELTTFHYFQIGERNFIFRLLYSFIIVIYSIDVINKLAFERIILLKDHRFLICLGLIVFYFYNIIVEAFCIRSLNFSMDLLKSIFNIKIILNFLINILYAIALLCIPKKKTFIW